MIIKRATIGVIILAGSLLAAGCTKTETPAASIPDQSLVASPTTVATPSSGEVLSGTVQATIKDFAFSPATLKVKKGTTVVWTNQDSVKHNAYTQTAGGPQGPLIGKGETYSYTFNQVGTFNYICQPHPYMKGVVEVVE